MRDKAITLMLAVATGDSDGLADTALAMGKPRGRVDLPAFRGDVALIAEKYLGRSLAEIEVSAVVRDMIQCATKHDIEMPAELMMMGKALMTVEGVGKQLDPELDVVHELRPYLTQIVMHRYSPERIGRDLLRGARQLSAAATTLPGQVHDVLEDLRSGRLAVIASDPDRVAATDRLGRRLFSGVVIASLVGSATALLAVDTHTTFAIMLYTLATMFGFTHSVADWWRNRKRRRPRRG
jgi:ubiquinone biosynthesis protein